MAERKNLLLCNIIKILKNNVLYCSIIKKQSPHLAGEKKGSRPPQAERKKKIISNIACLMTEQQRFLYNIFKNNVLYCSITKSTFPPLAGKKGQSSAVGGTKKENHIKYCSSDGGTTQKKNIKKSPFAAKSRI
jgi:hypothetical protein